MEKSEVDVLALPGRGGPKHIRPISGGSYGVGFFSMERQPQYAEKYKEVQVGRYWNYLFTPDNYTWPDMYKTVQDYVIDGFSPNLNKSLHVGHLRQLALAKSLKSVLNCHHSHKAAFVALLGASQGVYKYAQNQLQAWFDFLDYHPEVYYDVLMPRDLVEFRQVVKPDPSAMQNLPVGVYDGPKGEVIVVRSDGRPTYAFHDLAFAKLVGPTHYITGVEQKEHFESVGLGDKHLGMGLVLGADGKKLKSRDGSDEAKAESVMQEMMANLDDTCPEKRKLAWNVLAWNFLVVARGQNVKYMPEDWTKADSAGMYITYTYARIKKALKGVNWSHIPPARMKAMKLQFQPKWDESKGEDWDSEAEYAAWDKNSPDPQYDLTDADAELLGFADSYKYYLQRSVDTLDSTHVATYAHSLARMLGKAYHAEKIQGGRYGFQFAVNDANEILRRCMWYLGMFDLEVV